MKLLRKILLLFSILSLTIFTSCYVEQVNSEDVFEIMKRSAIPFFVLAQFGRWVSLTNEYTPYTVYNFGIIEDSITNIINLTNKGYISNNIFNIIIRISNNIYSNTIFTNLIYIYTNVDYYSNYTKLNSKTNLITNIVKLKSIDTNINIITNSSNVILYWGNNNIIYYQKEISNYIYYYEIISNITITNFYNVTNFISNIIITNVSNNNIISTNYLEVFVFLTNMTTNKKANLSNYIINIETNKITNLTRTTISFSNNNLSPVNYFYNSKFEIELLREWQPQQLVYAFKLDEKKYFSSLNIFNSYLTNSKGIGITGNIIIKNENQSMELLITNLLYGTYATSSFYDNAINSIKSFGEVNSVYTNSGISLLLKGTYNNENYLVIYKQDNFNISFGGLSNEIQQVIGSCEASVIIRGLKYDFKITFAGLNATITPSRYSQKFNVSLTNL